MPDSEHVTTANKPEPLLVSSENDRLKKIEELRCIFPWVHKKQVVDLSMDLCLNWKFNPKTILGVGVYKDKENDLAQYKRALGCLIYFLKNSGYSFKCSFNSAEVKFTYKPGERENLELVELELLLLDSAKSANEIFQKQNPVPGIDVLWALAFNTEVCAQFNKSYPVLIIPGIEVDNKFVAVYCVNKSICLTTISKKNTSTKVCYPTY